MLRDSNHLEISISVDSVLSCLSLIKIKTLPGALFSSLFHVIVLLVVFNVEVVCVFEECFLKAH